MENNIRIIETLIVHEEEARQSLWNIYSDAFERLNRRTPIHHGGYDSLQFDAILLDEDFTKFLVYSGDELAGATLITNVLTKVPWVNAGYFETHYPNRCREGKIYFNPEETPFEYKGDPQKTAEGRLGDLFTMGDIGEDQFLIQKQLPSNVSPTPARSTDSPVFFQ